MSKKKDNNFKESIKIILVGDSGVGKTSIINRYYLNEFRSDIESTQSMNFVIKDILIKGRKIQLNIWDTLGQEKYYSCNKLFIKNSNIVILVYDITRKNSFENLDFWYNCINNELGKDFSLGLAGNKFDLINQEEVSEEEGIDKAKVWGAHFSLLSAKSDKDGIDIYFEELVKKYLDISISLTEFVLLEQNGLEKTIKLDRCLTIDYTDEDKGCCAGGKKKMENDIRMIFLGCNGVGKTNIIQAIKGKKINTKYEPTKKAYKVNYAYNLENNKKINVKIYDTNGDFIKDNDDDIKILKKCKIFFFIFDIKKRNTFDELDNYINQIKNIYKEKNMHICILGNKINSNEENEDEIIEDEEAENFAKKFKANYQTVCINDSNNIRNILNNEINNYLNQ